MSRPPIDIDQKQLKELMRFKPRLEDAGAFFECTGRTIERYIKEHFDLTFSEFRDRYMVKTRMDLIRRAIDEAMGGNTVMLIFCLKNMCGWRDKQPDENEIVVNNVTSKTDEDLDKRIKELIVKAEGKIG